MKQELKYLKRLSVFLILGGICFSTAAQDKKQINLEDIWQLNTFASKGVYGINWMRDGNYYTVQSSDSLRNGLVLRNSILTGKTVDTVLSGAVIAEKLDEKTFNFSSYAFSADESKVLLATKTEPIYRRSTRAFYYVFDRKSQSVVKVWTEKVSLATFSPDGSKVAWVAGNNLFFMSLSDGKPVQVTTDGSINSIINGSTDWVYEEEFGFSRAYEWSPDGKRIAYYRFDESNVPEYNMQNWGVPYPEDYRYKYPKAGEKNAKVEIFVFDLNRSTAVKADIGSEEDIYVPRINWTQNCNLLSIRKMNRLQNTLEMYHVDAASGKSTVVMTEKSETYIDIFDDLIYLKNGNQFLYPSEKDGYKHLYLYDMSGKLLNQITKGMWEVDNLVGLEEKSGTLYYTSTEVSPMERNLYSVNISGKGAKLISAKAGINSINMSPDFRYYINTHSSFGTPSTYTLHKAKDGAEIRVMEDNKALKDRLNEYALGKHEFFRFKTVDGSELNGYMIKPANFDPKSRYPVLMHVYGGPGSQQVRNSWGGSNYLWHQMLTQKGYIIVCVDNRGTGGRGEKFKKQTYRNLGKMESEDQIAAAKYLSSLSYVSKERIGIWGWSYGGYMSSLSLMNGADEFKVAIAVAPVSNWRLYDTIYTERYMGLPSDNVAGYDDYSPNMNAEKLRGRLLLVHGTGDDNVHFQNAVQLTDALVKANKQFDSFYYPNRNHGIGGGNTRLHLYQMMTDFLERNL